MKKSFGVIRATVTKPCAKCWDGFVVTCHFCANTKTFEHFRTTEDEKVHFTCKECHGKTKN